MAGGGGARGRRGGGGAGGGGGGGGGSRLRVCTLNALGDALAFEHRGALYPGAPTGVLRWPGRLRALARQVYLLRPDVLLLQEVDRFEEVEAVLRRQGYEGAYQQRHGKPDGCATFWRRYSGLRLVCLERCLFHRYGLKNNVGLLCVLALPVPRGAAAGRRTRVVVGNTHVAFSPKRGDVKLGQVRTLVEAAHAVARGPAAGGGAPLPVVLGGDFNSTPASGVVEFLLSGSLELGGRDRRQLSGQLMRSWSTSGSGTSRGGPAGAAGGPEGGALEGGAPERGALEGGTQERGALEGGAAEGSGPEKEGPLSALGWDCGALEAALGPGATGSCVRHGLRLRSAHADANDGAEPAFTTAHRRFLGTVDYLFYSTGRDGGGARPLRCWTEGGQGVLEGRHLPHEAWPSDHVALVCDFQLSHLKL